MTLKLYHNELLLGDISGVDTDQPWMIGSVHLTRQAVEYEYFFSFVTDESKSTDEPPFDESLLENWYVEDESGNRREIEFPAVHEDKTIYWRWK
jgi:hypothetical protein